MSAVTARQAKINASRRSALVAALQGKTEANSRSLATSYALPVPEVQSAMRSMGVSDNG